MRDRASVHENGVRIIGLVEKLVVMDLVLPVELTTDMLLLLLPSSFDYFVVNFNMNKMEPTLEELVHILVRYESTIKKEKPVLYVGSSSGAKKRPRGNGEKPYVPPPKKNVPLNRKALSPVVAATPIKDGKTCDVCHYCKNP
ncbi:uncharacterized protein [Henckelia pumila]|uniref:uncharacterized protein n=1 Tax=Henckelia pumila TaxID=405737 RepID=UPI003C6E3BFF